jgi:hypothetical protein
MSAYLSYTDRMAVTVPVGDLDGLAVQKFEVKDIDTWTDADDHRDDVVSLMEFVRMIRDGRECKPGWYTRLVDRNELDDRGHPLVWMSDTTAERDDHKIAVAHIELGKANRVLINGLGLGMVLQAALSYGHVTHVDVVESDKRVIDLIGPHYTKDPRVNIVHADAYEQSWNWPRGTRWDVAWSDIWPTIGPENIEGMDRLNSVYRRRAGWHGMWCRTECLRMRRYANRDLY